MNVRLPWRESEIELDLPDDWRVIAEGRPKSFAARTSVEEEFARAMAEPIGAAPLAGRDLRGQRIVLVVDDLTRPTPAHLFFPYLLRELERAGAVLRIEDVVSQDYVRLDVIDRPGTLARIATLFGQARIGISSVIQPEGHEGRSVPLILMIHDASNAAMTQALGRINRLSVVKSPAVMIRVEDFR